MAEKKVGIAGFGTMGSEIALLCAIAGYQVTAFDVVTSAFERSLVRLKKLLRLLKRDASDEKRDEIMSRISTSGELSALFGSDLVIEAVFESYQVKQELLQTLGQQLKDSAICATNTSSLSVTRLASMFGRQENFIGMHFFNPPTQMKLVEIIPALLTGEETKKASIEFVRSLGKAYVLVKETPGFIVNRVLVAMAISAMELAEEGVAGVREIDEALKLGAGWPMGPFKLMDLVGLDVFLHACEGIYSELQDPKFRPPQMLKRFVQAGLLGRKTKRGFYQY